MNISGQVMTRCTIVNEVKTLSRSVLLEAICHERIRKELKCCLGGDEEFQVGSHKVERLAEGFLLDADWKRKWVIGANLEAHRGLMSTSKGTPMGSDGRITIWRVQRPVRPKSELEIRLGRFGLRIWFPSRLWQNKKALVTLWNVRRPPMRLLYVRPRQR